MLLSAEEKLRKARMKLSSLSPFYYTIAMHLKFVKSDRCPSIGVGADGILVFNEEWINNCTMNELVYILCHECLHVAFLHLIRKKERNAILWNIAVDLVVNKVIAEKWQDSMLVWTSPKLGGILTNPVLRKLFDTEVKGKTAEEVYQLLPQIELKERMDEHYFQDENEDQIQKLKEKWKQVVSDAMVRAKMVGQVSGDEERFVESVLSESVNWREVLYKYITKEIPFNYTWTRPNKKFQDVYLPSFEKSEKLELIVALDCSGSIDDKLLQKFISEVCAISKSFINVKAKVLVWDTKISKEIDLETANDVADLKFKGGGGTDFTCVEEWLNENQTPDKRLTVVLTDLCFDFKESFKDIENLIWVVPKNSYDKDKVEGYVIEIE